MKVVKRWCITTDEYRYGITEVDVDNGLQTYPYETESEAQKNIQLLRLKRNSNKERDPQYTSTLKSIGRI